MTDAPIEIEQCNPSWPQAFLRERQVIEHALAPWLAGLPEHIGSTAVPGLAAKPVIDIMAPVLSLEAAIPAIAAAAEIGYVHFPYQPLVMHWFCKPSPAMRTHHLHLVPVESPLWIERLAFRDALRASGELRLRYEELKRVLAVTHRNDREAYTEAKSEFISSVLGKGETSNHLRELEHQRTRALVERDMAVIERLHAPEYQLITPSGAVFSRERYLAALAAEPFYAKWEVGEIDVRVSAEMALLRYQATLHFPSGRVVVCWHTDSYERRGLHWQAVWSQATELKPR